MGLWTLAELAIGIVSACLPTMRPLFSKAHSTLRRSSKPLNSPFPEVREILDSSIASDLQQTPSNPAHSKMFAHLGVLGDLERGPHDRVISQQA